MRPGRKPLPAALKRVRGNTGHRPITDDVRFCSGEPRMPAHLDRRARAIWRELVSLLQSTPDLLTLADGIVLGNLCEIRSRRLGIVEAIEARKRRALKEAKLKAQREGLTISAKDLEAMAHEASVTYQTPTKCIIQHPLIGTMNKLAKQENDLCRELGLTPSARCTMKFPARQARATDSLLSALASPIDLKDESASLVN